jgi:hypothetical protein
VTARTLKVIEGELHQALKRETADIVGIGGLLLEAKTQMSHGRWLPWLRQGFSLSERSAQRYMGAAKFAKGKSATVSDLALSPSALYLVSNGELPAKAVAAILKEAATKRVGADRAHEIAAPFLRKAKEASRSRKDRDEAGRDEIDLNEIDKLLDGPPPELPPTEEASSPAVMALRQKFDDAVRALLEIRTKSTARLGGTSHTASDLVLVARFLGQVADQLLPPDALWSSSETSEAIPGLTEGLS